MKNWKSWAFATLATAVFTFVGASDVRADNHGHFGGHHGYHGGHHGIHHGGFGHHAGVQPLRPAVPTYSPSVYGYGGGYNAGFGTYQAPLQRSYRVVQPRVRHHSWHPGHFLFHH